MKLRNLARLSLLAAIIPIALPLAAGAQNDPAVDEFWAKFKAAVQKSDKASVAAMSQFPIEISYGIPRIRTRAQLARRWRELFKQQGDAVKCFEEAKPAIDPG